MKKILSMLLAASMAFSMSITTFAADFKDTENIPQSEAIDVIETLGVVSGYGNGIFAPNDVLTRAQLCTMLTQALYDKPIYSSTNQFKDVPVTHWANAYINTAYAYGLMKGYGEGYFGPEDKITYTQMVAVIMNTLGYDLSKMSWPTGVNSMAHTLGMFDKVKIIDYSQGCSRADAAQIMYNAFELNYVNHKADYPTIIKNKTFLEDGLGFTETTEVIDGHLYVAYEDKDGKIYTTENRLTYDKTIYPVGDGNEYRFKNSSKRYEIDWYKSSKDPGVILYVNGAEIAKNKFASTFNSYEKAIGAFDEDDNLISIHIESTGIDFIYSIDKDAEIYNLIKNDKEWKKNKYDMTVTYFEETNEYILSDKVEYGWITKAYKSAIYVNGMKIDTTDIDFISNGYAKNDFVKVFYNYRDEIVAVIVINDPYRYDVEDKIYHTIECDYLGTESNDMTYNELASGRYTFKPCSNCHADGNMTINK